MEKIDVLKDTFLIFNFSFLILFLPLRTFSREDKEVKKY